MAITASRFLSLLLTVLLVSACGTPAKLTGFVSDAHSLTNRASEPLAPLDAPRQGRVLGMTDSEVRAWLGGPRLLRDEADVQYWRYSYLGCTLDLFVYLDGATPRVGHHDVRLEPSAVAKGSERCRRFARHLAIGNGHQRAPSS